MVTSLTKDEFVICDRYVWSTLAYHSAWENVSPESMINIAWPFVNYLAMPQMVVFLKVSRESQKLRSKNRPENNFQFNLLMSDEFQLRLSNAYLKAKNLIKVPWIEIDTSQMSFSESVEGIVAAINDTLDRRLKLKYGSAETI